MLLFEESSQLLAQGGFSYLKLSGWYYLPVKNGFLGDLREFFEYWWHNGAECSGSLFRFSTRRNLGFAVVDI